MNRLRAEALHALDTQLSILNFYKSREGQLTMVGFIADMVEKDRLYVRPQDDPNEYAAMTGLRIAQETATELGHAATYYITPEMMALNLHAGESVPNSPFTEDEPPTPSGFVLLPEPLVTRDVHGKRMATRAFAWWKTIVRMRVDTSDVPEIHTPTLMYALFANKNDYEYSDYDYDLFTNHKEHWLAFPTWSMIHWQFITFDGSWAETELGGVRVQVKPKEHDADDIPGQQMFSWMAFLKSFFQLVKQEVAVLQPQALDRSHWRRLKGTGIMPEYGDLRIVTLRRLRPHNDHEEGLGNEVEWSHRWIVSGHWANAYHPSCDKCQTLGHACKTHPAVYKQPYEKGPENKPLIIKDRVFIWKR